LGNRKNAVKTQIWYAVATYALIAIIKKELQLKAPLYTLLQILSVSVFEKTELTAALAPSSFVRESVADSKQLNLFNI
jgi:hypothetical protein